MRVLIVEDEALIAMALADSLEDAGHEVVGPAATMAEALALCEGAPPELAVLDINLRDGSNGVDGRARSWSGGACCRSSPAGR